MIDKSCPIIGKNWIYHRPRLDIGPIIQTDRASSISFMNAAHPAQAAAIRTLAQMIELATLFIFIIIPIGVLVWAIVQLMLLGWENRHWRD